MKRYIVSILRYLIMYLLGFIAFYIINYLTNALNVFLNRWIPDLFVVYNQVHDHEELILQKENFALVSAVISVIIISVITVNHDDSRYEVIISETDGFYTIKDGMALYISKFLKADILSSVLVPLVTYPLIFIKVPNGAPRVLKIIADYIENIAVIPSAFVQKCGFIYGLPLLFAVSLLARIPAALFALRSWRGNWLSETDHREGI